MSAPTLHNSTADSPYHYDSVGEQDDPPSQDLKPQALKSPSYGPRKTLGFATLLPLVTILFWSFGMGSILIIWLFVKRISPVPGPSSHIFDGYLVVDEGNKTGSQEMLDGQESLESTMTGVLIITAISHFSSMAVVPLMALGAFYVAAKWLDDQSQSKEGPTPLQFGLVMQMCSSGTWDSLLMTLKYLFRNWRSKEPAARAKVSSLIFHAASICAAVVALHYGVVLTDLLLSAELGSAYYTQVSEVDVSSDIASTLGTQYDPQYYREFGQQRHPDWGKNVEEGFNTVAGKSTKYQIHMINTSTSSNILDTSSMAVIVRPTQSQYTWAWKAPTMGLSARCRAMPCPNTGRTFGSFMLACGFYRPTPFHPVPLPSFDYVEALVGLKPKTIGYMSSGERLQHLIPRNVSEGQENSLYFGMYLRMDEPMRPSPAPLEVNFLETSVNGTDLRFTVYIGACQVTLFDVELSFDGSEGAIGGANSQADSMSYSFASPPVPMSQDKAMRVFSYLDDWEPGSGSLMNYYLTPALGPTVYGAISSTPGFSNTLADEFARQCLAYIAANGAKLVPANSVVNQSVKLVSRYPLARTMAYVAVVYAHGLLAIILFAGIVRKSSKTVVVDEPMQQVDWRGTLVSKKQKPVQELILVQSRLTDPLSIVAEHFLETESESQEKTKAYTSPGVLSAQTDAVAMFDVEGPDTKRVEVGLIDSQGSERWYGLRHRKKDILATMSDTEKAA